eukprot:gene9736-2063_t
MCFDEKNKPNPIQIVKLNIGNVKYVTTYETLSCAGENYLTSLYQSKLIPVLDHDDFIFIDRDGKYFEPILEYLRSSVKEFLTLKQRNSFLLDKEEDQVKHSLSNIVSFTDDLSLIKLNKEIDFYCINMPKFYRKHIEFFYNKSQIISGESLESIEELDLGIKEQITTKTISRISKKSRVWTVGYNDVLDTLINDGWKIENVTNFKDGNSRQVLISKVFLALDEDKENPKKLEINEDELTE